MFDVCLLCTGCAWTSWNQSEEDQDNCEVPSPQDPQAATQTQVPSPINAPQEQVSRRTVFTIEYSCAYIHETLLLYHMHPIFFWHITVLILRKHNILFLVVSSIWNWGVLHRQAWIKIALGEGWISNVFLKTWRVVHGRPERIILMLGNFERGRYFEVRCWSRVSERIVLWMDMRSKVFMSV